VLFHGRWRIQHNVVTDHYRLLDPDNTRNAWGAYEQCRAKLDQLRAERDLQPATGKVVVVLHGLAAHRAMMAPIVAHLEKEGGYTAINVTYPTTHGSIADHARGLAGIVANLPQATEIHFVAHSLGNLVVRHYLADATDVGEGRHPDPRIGRFVMLGPPNHGARCAVVCGGNPVYDNLLGDAAQQLGRRWSEVEPRLATPASQFAVIPGGLDNTIGFNPLLPGDDDGLVTVSEARLDGARDFALLNVHHFLMPCDATVKEYTLRFLQQGRFRAEGPRQPIVPDRDRQAANPPRRH
jgi:hypothetical protein